MHHTISCGRDRSRPPRGAARVSHARVSHTHDGTWTTRATGPEPRERRIVWMLPLDFWRDFLSLVGRALSLDGGILLAAPDDVVTYTVALALAGAAGVSLTLGHSVLLFA